MSPTIAANDRGVEDQKVRSGGSSLSFDSSPGAAPLEGRTVGSVSQLFGFKNLSVESPRLNRCQTRLSEAAKDYFDLGRHGLNRAPAGFEAWRLLKEAEIALLKTPIDADFEQVNRVSRAIEEVEMRLAKFRESIDSTVATRSVPPSLTGPHISEEFFWDHYTFNKSAGFSTSIALIDQRPNSQLSAHVQFRPQSTGMEIHVEEYHCEHAFDAPNSPYPFTDAALFLLEGQPHTRRPIAHPHSDPFYPIYQFDLGVSVTEADSKLVVPALLESYRRLHSILPFWPDSQGIQSEQQSRDPRESVLAGLVSSGVPSLREMPYLSNAWLNRFRVIHD